MLKKVYDIYLNFEVLKLTYIYIKYQQYRRTYLCTMRFWWRQSIAEQICLNIGLALSSSIAPRSLMYSNRSPCPAYSITIQTYGTDRIYSIYNDIDLGYRQNLFHNDIDLRYRQNTLHIDIHAHVDLEYRQNIL